MKVLLTSVLLGVCTTLNVKKEDREGSRQLWYNREFPAVPLKAAWPSQIRVHPNAIAPQLGLQYPNQSNSSNASDPNIAADPLRVYPQLALQFPSKPRVSTPYSGWPWKLFRNPPLEFSDCLYNFYYCTDSTSPGWPANKDACETIFKGCEEYLRIQVKPLFCSTQPQLCNCPTGALGPDASSAPANDAPQIPQNRSSCEELISDGVTQSGVFTLVIDNKTVDVYCDMKKEGGGWTVLQRRGQYGATNDFFDKNWETYKLGFGNLTQDLWVGLEYWNKMTASKPQQMLVTLQSKAGLVAEIVVNDLSIGDEQNQYSLNFTTVEAEDDMGKSLIYHKTAKFSTPLNDNDSSIGNCAEKHRAGWWFVNCREAALTLTASGDGGMAWYGSSKTSGEDWIWSEMKIRSMARRYTRPSPTTQ